MRDEQNSNNIVKMLGINMRIHFQIQVQLKEVVLDETDVARALLDYISKQYVGSIVVGSSTRNALTRFVSETIFNC